MADTPQRVRIDEIDWRSTLRFTRIFRSFRMAIHPAKLLTSLLLVMMLYISGQFLDAVIGPTVVADEISQYQTLTPAEFSQWREGAENRLHRSLDMLLPLNAENAGSRTDSIRVRLAKAADAINDHYAKRRAIYENDPESPLGEDWKRGRVARIDAERKADLKRLQEISPRGVFKQSAEALAKSFEQFVTAASTADFGVTQVLRDGRAPNTVAGALREMVIVIPGWAMFTHPLFFFTYTVLALAIWALLGGAVARMSATHATRDERTGFLEAILYAARYWAWFLLAPLLIPLIASLVCVVIFVIGFAIMGVPYARMVTGPFGGLIFGVVILLSFVVTILTVALVGSHTLLYPGLAVEGTDGFDANSRAVGYVIARPWHLLFYNAVTLVYGALTYLFVLFVVYLTLKIAQFFVEIAASIFTRDGFAPFEAIMPTPKTGQLSYEIDWAALDTPGKITAVFVMVWVYLFIGLLAAYAISFFFSSQTQIYLLLRRSADGTDFEELYVPSAPANAESEATPAAKAVPDKVEAGAAASTGASTEPAAKPAPAPPAAPPELPK